jgi:hydrogenase maturation protease
MKPASILIYGFGNPGREDDGAGVALAEQVRAAALPGVTADSNYQLNIEDALLLRGHDLVVFADASKNAVGQFRFSRLEPVASVAFTTHAVPPEAVLALCLQLYQTAPPAYLLEIGGASCTLREGLSAAAAENTAAAEAFLLNLLRQPSFDRFEEAAGFRLGKR